jgi:hypothetical protein
MLLLLAGSPSFNLLRWNEPEKMFASSCFNALFSFQKFLQNFLDFPSHRIFRHMHETLNIDKK